MSENPVRIGVFTATRAEYGLLRPVLAAMERSARLEPLLIVSGTHLSARHGMTVSEIEADGRAVAARIPLAYAGDDAASVAADMATVLAGAARVYEEIDLDAVLLLGDRTELLAAAAAAVPENLPIVHLEGGHLTEGAVDDGVRHAISKLAALHFTAAEPYRRRLLQMGEPPERVFTVGSTAVDNLRALPPMDIAALSRAVGAELEPGLLLVTHHPETRSTLSPEAQIEAVLAGLDRHAERQALITLPNADIGGGAIGEAITAFASARPERVIVRASLGSSLYLSALRLCGAVVGNSSSGVIEAPAAGAPSVNIGDRQKGRLRPLGVIDCATDAPAIAEAIGRALDPDLRPAMRSAPPPFGDGQAARRIVEVLETTDWTGLGCKPFVDL
jgi:UDP-N-acetylglucosamine 2-epimerase (non-hydrolysing)